jgi:hypothetical protein
VGPAPRTGRPRWAAFADALAGRDVAPILDRLHRDPSFQAADSDGRFARFEAALRERPPADAVRVWRDDEGRPVATIRRSGSRLTFVVDEKIAPEFGEFLAGLLPELHARHQDVLAKAGRDGCARPGDSHATGHQEPDAALLPVRETPVNSGDPDILRSRKGRKTHRDGEKPT